VIGATRPVEVTLIAAGSDFGPFAEPWAFSRSIWSRAGYQRAQHAAAGGAGVRFVLPRIACIMSFMPKDAINDDVLKYQGCLESIRQHLNTIEGILTGQINLGIPELAMELVFLHFRKALEEMAFSSLCANVDQYTAAYKDVTTVWSAKRLLERVGKANPNFYPEPMHFKAGVLVGDPPPHLTKNDFLFLYSLASDLLHSSNPYRTEPPPDVKYSPSQWLARFRNLLRMHLIQLVDYDETWTAVMPDQGQIQIGVARLVPIPTRPVES
jgi:hypothetical protein